MALVKVPNTREQLDQVRTWMHAFVELHCQRHVKDIQLIDEYFNAPAFEEKLASLPGKYAPPRGTLLLATHEDSLAGCVALREIDAYTCEMKRLFVYAHRHRKGVGKALVQALIEHARTIGYQSMRLNTNVGQDEAEALYQSVGFRVIKPYYELPEKLRNWLVFMELKL